MTIQFDEIAEVACGDCDWFGMLDELIIVTTDKLGSHRYCPECKSENLAEDKD